MVSEIVQKKNARKTVIYGRSDGNKPDEPPLAVEEDSFGYMASCPVCKKRIFDVSDTTGTSVHVRLKCPHCRNIVKISISPDI